jgi:hypothetical protein
MEPLDENLEVSAWRKYYDHDEIKRMAAHFKIDPADLNALAKRMPDWEGHPGGVDRSGLYALPTYNPDGRWDWYEIGGRWDGYIPHAKRNVIKAKTLAQATYLGKCLPYFLLTPGGEWIEHERYYLAAKGVEKEAMKDRAWESKVRDILNEWRDEYVVCVDIHN